MDAMLGGYDFMDAIAWRRAMISGCKHGIARTLDVNARPYLSFKEQIGGPKNV